MSAPGGASVAGLFLGQAVRHGDRPALVAFEDGAWRSMGWDDVARRARNLAGGLVEAGVGAHDRVLLVVEHGADWIIADLAIQLTGAVPVPLHPTLTDASVRHLAHATRAELAIVSGELRAARLNGNGLPRRVLRTDGAVDRWQRMALRPETERALRRRCAGVGPDDVWTVTHTSGATGPPKPVILTHGAAIDTAEALRAAFDLGPGDVTLSCLSHAHVFERVFALAAMAAGATIWLSRGIDHVPDDVRAARPTVLAGPPAVLEAIHVHADREAAHRPWPSRALQGAMAAAGRGPGRHIVPATLRGDATGGRVRLVVCCGGPLPARTRDRFRSAGAPVYEGWGLAEACGVVAVNRPGLSRAGTAGTPLPGIEVRAAPDGELLVRGPGAMAGYDGRPDGTAPAPRHGWIPTGDVGSVDADGYVTVTDRKPALIAMRGGAPISPAAIEARLASDPCIAAALVVGAGRPYLTALLVPRWPALAARAHLVGAPEELVAHPAVRAALRRSVARVNGTLPGRESIRNFRLLPRPFTTAGGELTPSFTLRREVVELRHRSLIEQMY